MKESVKVFLDYLTAERGLSQNTVSAYGNDLSQLVDFLEESWHLPSGSRGWQSVGQPMLTQYALDLQKRGYSATTRARKIASAKSFFNFLFEEGLISQDPTESLASPRIGRALPKSLSEEEVGLLLEEASRGSSLEARRDMAMIELMYATGMRVGELVSLAVGDLNLKEKYVRCLGKGAKERVINIHDEAVNALDTYLREVRPHLLSQRKEDGVNEDALFLNRRGERLTRQGFWLILKGCGRRANMKTPITPHTLRHSFATHMLRGGAPLRYLQELLGHASITTTQVYTHLAQEQVQKEYDKAHPRAH
ncbi:MAG: site-specific tyrosine recombinase XerD [Chloroflexi bacterium]|nr:site-specific tyrosine recombinase XerD [Chloroflexota bacterium]